MALETAAEYKEKINVKNNRPVNLDLTTMRFPITAIASILHRLSGIVLFLLMPVTLCFFSKSLASADAFQQLGLTMGTMTCRILTWMFLTALTYHLLAGIRHMIMDMGFGEGLTAGLRTSSFVIFLAIILSILLGMWIW